MPSLESLLHARLAAAFKAVAGQSGDPVLRRSQFADYQANGALPLAKRLKRPPREIAEAIVAAAALDDLCSAVEISGPGFINLTVADAALGAQVGAAQDDARLGVEFPESPATVVVDYSAPNAAKEMHVGHLRSTIIGDATVRLLDWRGHEVIRENHIGDWGTPFGMLIEHLLDIGEAEAAHELSVGDLTTFYQAARGKFDAEPEFQERSRRRVVALQAGDEQTLRFWHMLIEQSEKYFMAVYRRLGVKLTEDDFMGESAYNDQLASVVEELDELGLLREDQGADCVFPAGFTNRDGDPLPLIVRKSDGGYGYAATDLATIRDRLQRLGGTRLLYVVGLPQRQHLEMIFQTAREAGWLVEPAATAEHIGHGAILGEDGKILRTRAGASVKLVDLLDEAVARAREVVAEKSPHLDEATQEEVARGAGIGAVKYADLSTDRVQDYVFSYERMLALEGNTAPYIQYAHARIKSIFRRADPAAVGADGHPVVSEPPERELAIELLRFPEVFAEVEETLEFHRLAGYLYGVATAFTDFYEKCPVLKAEPRVQHSRLVLCDVTARTLALGLALLGITAPDHM